VRGHTRHHREHRQSFGAPQSVEEAELRGLRLQTKRYIERLVMVEEVWPDLVVAPSAARAVFVKERKASPSPLLT